jgi:Tat protein secretion system quality control protein TatD with DNase activity
LNAQVVAVGLATLDFTRDKTADQKKLQIDGVTMQAKLASNFHLPLMLEVKAGAGEVAAALLRMNCHPSAAVYLHGWGCEPKFAMDILKGFPNAYVGFTGAVTFAKSKTT